MFGGVRILLANIARILSRRNYSYYSCGLVNFGLFVCCVCSRFVFGLLVLFVV